MTERILCAAIWVDTGKPAQHRPSFIYPETGILFCGHRHGDCFAAIHPWRARLSEEEIKAGVRTMVARHHTLVEGAAGAAVAAFTRRAEHYEGKDVAIVLCGANIGAEVLKEIL